MWVLYEENEILRLKLECGVQKLEFLGYIGTVHKNFIPQCSPVVFLQKQLLTQKNI